MKRIKQQSYGFGNQNRLVKLSKGELNKFMEYIHLLIKHASYDFRRMYALHTAH